MKAETMPDLKSPPVIDAAIASGARARASTGGRHPAIRVTGLTKIYSAQQKGISRLMRRTRGPEVRALHNLGLTLEPGEFFGLVGRNGQGKTTLIKCIASLIEPTAGSVEVFGHDTIRHEHEARRRIGLVSSDERSFYGRLTSRQNLEFFARLHGLPARQIASRIAALAEQFAFTGMLARRFQELSSGNKQRLSLLRALLTEPPLLLLDEPTRSLDPIAADNLRDALRAWMAEREGRTILLTSHNLQEVDELCSRVGILSGGELKLLATMEELKHRYADRERVRLWVAGVERNNGFAAPGFEIPAYLAEPEGNGRLRIEFNNMADRSVLDMVLRRILEQGGTIERVENERIGLREILTMVEEDR